MNTFMPFPSFSMSAQVLDNRRLGKQRVEAMQILNILEGKTKSKAWVKHPAVLMWKGYERALRCYHDTIIQEWIKRGFKNNMTLLADKSDWDAEKPKWFGDPDVHRCYRQSLLFKDYNYYSKFGWTEGPKYGYKWGTQ